MTEEVKSGFDEEYAGYGLKDLILAMDAAQQNKEAVEERLKAINARFDYLRLAAVPNKMDEEGIPNITIEGVGRVGLTSDAYVSIKAGKKEEAWQWLSDNGHSDLITETVNPSSLKAAVKQMISKAEEVPEDLFNVTPFTRASITRKGVI